MLPLQCSGVKFCSERHFDGKKNRKQDIDQLGSDNAFSHYIYNVWFSFFAKGRKKIIPNPREVCCLQAVTIDPQKTTVQAIWHGMPLCILTQCIHWWLFKLSKSLYIKYQLFEILIRCMRKEKEKNIKSIFLWCFLNLITFYIYMKKYYLIHYFAYAWTLIF